jgi:hypothetical protein
MKVLHSMGVLAIVLALAGSIIANPSRSSGRTDSVLFLGQLYCVQMLWCPTFAFYGASTPVGYVELTTADGAPTAYLWIDHQGFMTFECSPLNIPPPGDLPLLGMLVDDGDYKRLTNFSPQVLPGRFSFNAKLWAE